MSDIGPIAAELVADLFPTPTRLRELVLLTFGDTTQLQEQDLNDVVKYEEEIRRQLDRAHGFLLRCGTEVEYRKQKKELSALSTAELENRLESLSHVTCEADDDEDDPPPMSKSHPFSVISGILRERRLAADMVEMLRP